jgi:hypothetical protein
MNVDFISSPKKVLIPGINFRHILPLASLLKPKDLVVSMSLICLLGQISNNLKGVLEPKEIQQIPSVKFYSKALMSGFSTLSLTTLFALSRTLGAELETLSSLNGKERFQFLFNLQNSILNKKISATIISNYRIFNDPYQILKFRKGISLQSRSVMIASSIYIPHSLVIGMSIDHVDLKVILQSCRLIWAYLSLSEEEFDFLLKKEASIYLSSIGLRFKKLFNLPLDLLDCIRLMLISELEIFSPIIDDLFFKEDYIFLRCDNNLTNLENDFKFIKRLIPNFPSNVFLSDYDLGSSLIRVAVNQRKEHVFNLVNVFKFSQKIL